MVWVRKHMARIVLLEEVAEQLGGKLRSIVRYYLIWQSELRW